jgi:hypothetical protein
VVDKKRDSVIIYTFPDGVNFERHILTEVEDLTANIL